MPNKIASGVVHKVPDDLRKSLSSKDVMDRWNNLTPLGRNEYICWITSAKKPETRVKRINWMKEDIKKGKKRPCCWPGCKHR